jgi:phytoene dehydrogenase-like protein
VDAVPSEHDAVVVGAGPNGLAAGIELARAGRSVLVLEAHPRPGGGLRSEELTLPGFVHDVCSSAHPLGAGSPFMRSLPLDELGVDWANPETPLAHPLDDGTAAVLERSVTQTARSLGSDAVAWRRMFAPLVRDGWALVDDLLGPPLHVPRHPAALARFGLRGALPATALGRAFRTDGARALLAGMAAHAILPLDRLPTGAVALVFGFLGHLVGWPFVRGGSERLAEAMLSHLRSLGAEVSTGVRVGTTADLPPAGATLFDVTPGQLARIARDRLPDGYVRALERYRYGPGAFKIDWALDAPIPWSAEGCRRAGTVHLGGTLEEIAAGERAVWRGEHPERPFSVLAQPTLFDPSRAPNGKHVAWAYCHVPNGSVVDMTQRIEAQVERFAPGFRERILARGTMTTVDLERHDENLVGGDIAGGAQTLRQVIGRPVLRFHPYATPVDGVYVCSSSTPPGAGVHGMCGYHAARTALRRSPTPTRNHSNGG